MSEASPSRLYRTILVGHGGDEGGGDAVELGRVLAELTAAELVVAGVVQRDPFLEDSVNAPLHRPRADGEAHLEKARWELQRVAEPAAARVEMVAAPSVPQGLHHLAERLDADLIVVGSSRRGRTGRVLAGSVGERLLHGSCSAVAVAPRGFAKRSGVSLRTVGVGYDGKPEAELALRAAAALSESLGAGLKVLAITPFAPTGKGWNLGLDVVDVAERDRLEEMLEAAVSSLPSRSHATGELLAGHPAEVLAEQDVDLLVVGSRGYGPLRSVMLGGVSGRLLQVASAPVLVLPRGTDSGQRVTADASGAAAA